MSNERLSFTPLTQDALSPRLEYLSQARYGKDWSSTLHTHPITEILFVQSGSGRIILDGRPADVERGDMVIINPNIPHTETSTEENPLSYLVLGLDKVHFGSLDSIYDDEPDSENKAPPPACIFHMQHKYDTVLSMLENMRTEIEEHGEYYETVVQNLLSLFLVFIMRNTSIIATHRATPKMSRDCALIKRFIDSHYTYNFSLDELADKIYVNKFHLIHIFKKYLGISPGNYILEKRLVEAKRLLENTDLTISDVCKEIGFSNSNHFSQTFKKREGLTPTAYRRAYAAKDKP